MNKKLVALAVAGACALPLAAEAQLQVTLYGRANMDLEFVKASGPGAADGSTSTVTRVSSNSSRFGLRGTEPLGGGLTAFFQVENSVPWDGSNAAGVGGTIGGRETFVGIQGSYGQIWLGRSLSPYDDVTPIWAAGPYNYNTGLFNNSSLWSNNSNAIGGEAIGGYDDRYSNSIRWNSPTWSGFTAEVQVATKENTGHSWVFAPGVFYNNGPIQAGFVYTRHDKIRCYNAAGTSYAACGAVPFAGFSAKDDAFSLAGSYDFGVARVGLVYEHLKYETPTGDLKRDFWGVSGTIPMGSGLWYVYYGRAGTGKGGASDSEARINSLVHGSDSASSNFEIGYRYDLSKRTSLNAGYVMIRNDARANYTFNVNSFAVSPGGDPQGFVLGIIHNF